MVSPLKKFYDFEDLNDPTVLQLGGGYRPSSPITIIPNNNNNNFYQQIQPTFSPLTQPYYSIKQPEIVDLDYLNRISYTDLLVGDESCDIDGTFTLIQTTANNHHHN